MQRRPSWDPRKVDVWTLGVMFHKWVLYKMPIDVEEKERSTLEKARNYHRWDLLPKDCQNILYACLEEDPAKRASMEQVFQMLSDIAKRIRGLKSKRYDSLRDVFDHREGMMWGGCEKECPFCKEQSPEKC